METKVAASWLDDRGSAYVWDRYLFLGYQVQTHLISYQLLERPELEAEYSSLSSAEKKVWEE
jgi:hypothetical protein